MIIPDKISVNHEDHDNLSSCYRPQYPLLKYLRPFDR